MAKRDYYEVLGLGKSASVDEIKRAYRKKAVELHPDKGGDAEKFKEVSEAYEVLKNPDKRQQYDQFGHGFSGAQFGGAQGFGGAGIDLDLDLGDIFSTFFGGGAPTRTRRETRARDIEVAISIDFKDAVFGTTQKLTLKLKDVCDRCKGSRAEPGAKLEACQTCGGSGRVVRTQNTILGSIQQTAVCARCDGRGEVPEKICARCQGAGTIDTTRTINLKIPAGIADGATVRLTGQGEAVTGGHKGDLYVVVNVKSHPKFNRRGYDIASEQTIDMVDAVLGAEMEVDTIDGPVKMKVPPGTQAGQSFKLSNRGVPHGSRRGNHLVTLQVMIPKKLTTKQKELLQQFAKGGDKKAFWNR